MTLNPEELSDAATLASARARLELALGDPSPEVAALIQNLALPGGKAWADSALKKCFGSAEDAVERVGEQLRELAQEAALEPDAQSRFLIGLSLGAAHLVARGTLPELQNQSERDGEGDELLDSATRAQVSVDDLLDLASFLPEQWCDLFARAARIMRGDTDEDPEGDAHAQVPTERLLSERIEGYFLLEPLGRGSFGTVYRAVDPDLNRQVALKLLRPEVFSKHAEERFLEEGRILSSLSHPGIAVLYSAGFDQHLGIRLPYLAMELVRGKSIVRFAEDNDLGVEARLRLVVQACDALHHAHQNQIVHRDVHPGNLIVREDGTLKVVDFGAAFAPGSGRHADRSGVLFGALAYISPEQARSTSGGVDARADVFGLGAILFELLCGEAPHDLENLSLHAALSLVTEGTPRRLREVDPKANADLDAICTKALAEDRDDRYGSALELGEDLRRFKAGLPVEARTPSFAYSMRKLARRHRREVAWLATCLVLITGLSIGAGLGWRRASVEASNLVETQGVMMNMVVSLVELAELQADKMGSSWDSGEFYQTWAGSLESLVLEYPEVSAVFYELLARHAMFIGDMDRAFELRTAIVSDREALLDEARRSGADADSLTEELSKAVVRLGDTFWGPLCLSGRVDLGTPEVNGEIAEVRRLFLRALELDRSLAVNSPSEGRLDNLVWSLMRLFDFELRLDREADAGEHFQGAITWSAALLELNVDRPHSHFAKAEIETRLYFAACRSEDIDQAVIHAKLALRHASLAFNGERDRVPFMRCYQRAMSNMSVAASKQDSVVGVDLGIGRDPLFETMALAYEYPEQTFPWRSAALSCVSAAREYSLRGQHFLAGQYYSEAARFSDKALAVASPQEGWLEEIWTVKYKRNAAASFELGKSFDLAEQLRSEAADCLEDVHAQGQDHFLVAAAEQLILRVPAGDPCHLLKQLEAFEQEVVGDPEFQAGAALNRILVLARDRCGE